MLMRLLLLALVGIPGLISAEPGGSPIFNDSEEAFRFRGDSGRFGSTTFPRHRPDFASPPSDFRQFEKSRPSPVTFTDADDTKVRMVNWEIGRGLDIIKGLGLEKGTTAASVSNRCQNGAMGKAAWSFQNVYRFNHVGRHDSLDTLSKSILSLPKGYESYIIAEHGNAGFAGQLTLERAPEIGAAIKKAGLKRVILLSCFTAHGEEGKSMIASLAFHSGAAIYAWDKTVYPEFYQTYLSEPGNLVVAIYDEKGDRTVSDSKLELPR